MAVDTLFFVFVSNGVETQKYRYEFVAGHGAYMQLAFDFDQRVTCIDERNSYVYFGLYTGNVAICRRGWPEEIITLPFDTPVTAIYRKPITNPLRLVETLYVAHGQHVSLIENGRDRTITTLHTLEGNNPITLLRSYNNVLYCFARNKVFLYNEDTRQFISQFDAESDVESVVCVFKHPEQDTVYMVYPDGIYAMYENDPNTFRLNNAYASTITSACQFGDFFAIFHKIPYMFSDLQTQSSVEFFIHL